MNERHPESTEQDVIRRYRAGQQIHKIIDATGVAQGTVYSIIRRAGISPNRNRTPSKRDRALALALELLDEDQSRQVLDILNEQ